jgi:hypothetical protein
MWWHWGGKKLSCLLVEHEAAAYTAGDLSPETFALRLYVRTNFMSEEQPVKWVKEYFLLGKLAKTTVPVAARSKV